MLWLMFKLLKRRHLENGSGRHETGATYCLGNLSQNVKVAMLVMRLPVQKFRFSNLCTRPDHQHQNHQFTVSLTKRYPDFDPSDGNSQIN